MKKDVITVHVVSDVACPWCYIGKRRLATALEQWKGKTVEVTWCPYQLDPNIPASGLDGHTYLLRKFGDLERIHEMTERLKALGAIEGINFNFGDKWLAVNTLALHQLLHVARDAGYGTLLKERFFKAYFEENLPLNNLEVLQGIMGEFGWEPSTTKKFLPIKLLPLPYNKKLPITNNWG
nr:DsbA family oxidoreductase [Croceitalea dokdonensis]